MSLAKTRACTPVYFGATLEMPTFVPREILKTECFQQRIFKSDSYMPMSRVLETLGRLQADAQREKQAQKKVHRPKPHRPKLPRNEVVNLKRRRIAACISNQTKLNYKAVARITKTDPATVKQVHWDLQRLGSPSTYTYNNLKDAQPLQQLVEECRDLPNTCCTVTDLKRSNPGFSRKFILKQLHAQQRRWCKLPKAKVSVFKPPNSKDVCSVVSHLTQVLAVPVARMMYLDEMKLPFHQSSEHQWVSQTEGAPTYAKRDLPDERFTVLALCDTKSFYAVQLFTRELTGDDFVFFLNSVLPTLPEGRRVCILADNATWHKSKAVMKSKGHKYLHFNVPHMFYLNLIENAFSAIRSNFRKRPLVHTMAEEARNVVNLFFAPENESRFKGYYRNHLRMLVKFGTRHSKKMQEEEMMETQS